MANISLGAAICTVYPPTGGVEDNERGLAILISVGEEDLLITGDMNAAAERRLLTAYELPGFGISGGGAPWLQILHY